MSRKTCVIMIALFCFALFTCSVLGQEEEAKKVRDLLIKEMTSCMKGDVQQILSCYADDIFVGYYAMTENPQDWAVWIDKKEELTKYAESHKGRPEIAAKHPDWQHINEVRHVNVKGDHAIAVTNHLTIMYDDKAREDIINEHQSVWLLTRSKGSWKITNFIGGVTQSQTISKRSPE